MRVCLDTNVFVWGVRETSTEGQEEQIAKSKALLEHLEDQGATIIIPAIVVGEILLALPVEQHAMTVNLMERAYITAPFDLGCAATFAKLWKCRKDDGTIASLIGDEGVTRNKLRADCLIIATAIQQGADVLYSNDGGMRRFAEGWIPCRDIPVVEVQQELFESAE